jgi:hypothetical protein
MLAVHYFNAEIYMKVGSLLLLVVVSGFMGCSGGMTTTPAPTPTPTPTFLNLTGDWGVTATSTVTAGSTFTIGVYLSSTQGSVSGIAHVFTLTPCYLPNLNVPLTGTIDTSGNISLVSSTVANEVLTITGKTTNGTSLASGTYSVAGGCLGGDKGTLAGGIVPAVTGTYSGSVHSLSGITIGVVAQLMQTSVPDVNGFLHLSGTAAFTGSPCLTQASIATPTADSNVIGLYDVTDFTIATPTTFILTNGTLSADGKTITITYDVIGGMCSGDSGSGSLVL